MLQKLINRKIFLITIDIIIVNLVLLVSLLLRFEFRIPPESLVLYAQSFIYYTAARIAFFYLFGLYKKLWQYASMDEFINIAMAFSALTHDF